MIRFGIILLILSSFTISQQDGKNIPSPSWKDTSPSMLIGDFKDDYGIAYTLTDSLFTQHPNVKYHIIKWNLKDNYFIAKNDGANPSEQNLYSRIDFMEFSGMEPFRWGFCLTVYDAPTDSIAETKAVADRKDPKKGCGGFPFSRMKRK
ncbi:hypothetical protein [Ferruginibacter sp. HRS2-29]|uniref:hypothetical protein n=1 Tax=Ferruginibacter sp. HRS2-29 TaxID=2487334 RepID=UPI0020CF0F68|nr:hypothetical protein [Ferruginibacter sp. HRS2-29]MCP9750016.1 hypothetical protein [Ferruginibacter sp. HRS2-29]